MPITDQAAGWSTDGEWVLYVSPQNEYGFQQVLGIRLIELATGEPGIEIAQDYGEDDRTAQAALDDSPDSVELPVADAARLGRELLGLVQR